MDYEGQFRDAWHMLLMDGKFLSIIWGSNPLSRQIDTIDVTVWHVLPCQWPGQHDKPEGTVEGPGVFLKELYIVIVCGKFAQTDSILLRALE